MCFKHLFVLSKTTEIIRHEITIPQDDWTLLNTLSRGICPNIDLYLFEGQENNISNADSSTNMTTHWAI